MPSVNWSRSLPYTASAASTILVVALVFVIPYLGDLLTKISWRYVIPIGLALAYFAIGISTWRELMPEIKKSWEQSEKSNVAFLALNGIFGPIALLFMSALEIVYSTLQLAILPLVHKEWHDLFGRCVGAFLLVVVFIYAVLFLANAWPDGQACKWVFPKILSCLLTTHDELAGGLLGAGGTIYAAWLAWIAIQRQIENQRGLRKEE